MKSSSVSECCNAPVTDLATKPKFGTDFWYGKVHTPVESVSHIKAFNGINFSFDREFESLIQDCRSCPGDESYRLHLADYILEKWEEL